MATARLFVALDLPARVRTTLAGWAEHELSTQLRLRLVPADSLHVTLCFLGSREEAQIDTMAGVVRGCASPPPKTHLRLGEPAWLPPRQPRVLAVDLADTEASVAALQARVSGALAAEAGYEPETRWFRPHVTVARMPRGTRLRAFAARPPPTLSFAGEALTLYRSRLGAAGARYEAVARHPLSSVDAH